MEFLEELALSTIPVIPQLWVCHQHFLCCEKGRCIGTSQQCASFHEVHQQGWGWSAPNSGHTSPRMAAAWTSRFAGNLPKYISTGLLVPPCQDGSGQVRVRRVSAAPRMACWQTPPVWWPEAERLFRGLHALFHLAIPPTCGRPPWGTTCGGEQATTEGVSEDIRWVCRKYSMYVVINFGQPFHSVQSKVIMKGPCQWRSSDTRRQSIGPDWL